MSTEDVLVTRTPTILPAGRAGVPGKNAASPVPPNGRDGRLPLPGPRGPYAQNPPNGNNGNNSQNQSNASNGLNGLDSFPGTDGALQYTKVWTSGTGYRTLSPISWDYDTNFLISPENNEVDLELARTYSGVTTLSTSEFGISILKAGRYSVSISKTTSLGSLQANVTVNGVATMAGLLTLNAGDVVGAVISSSSWGASWYCEACVCQV